MSESDADKLRELPLEASAVELMGLQAKIIGSRVTPQSRTLYVIRCFTDLLPPWEVERSYSEFDSLHTDLGKLNFKMEVKMPPKHWLKGSDDVRVVAERKAALPVVLAAMIPPLQQAVLKPVLVFVHAAAACEYWKRRHSLQVQCETIEGQLVGAEAECYEAKALMKQQVEEQELKTREIVRVANEELERVKQQTQITIHEANQELERVRQERFLKVAGKQSDVAALRQTVEETHSAISGMARRLPPMIE